MASGNMATAYFDGRHIHSANNLTVYIDDEKKGSYDGGSSYSVKVTPGDHVIRILVYNDASEEAYWLGPFPAHFEAGMEYDLAPGRSGSEEPPAPREEPRSTSYSYDSASHSYDSASSYSSTSHSYDSASRSYDSVPRSHNPAGTAAGRRGGCLIPVIVAAVLIFGVILCFGAFRSSVSNIVSQPQAAEPSDPPSDEAPDGLDAEQSGLIFPSSDSTLIDPWEAEVLSDRDLTYAINEIYARHGYVFKSAELREYYEQFSWYSGDVAAEEFSIECFNEIEQQNWNLLVMERNRRKASS